MDRHSEVELKFDATKVTLKQYHDFVASLTGEFVSPKTCRIVSYKCVKGDDIYFNLNGQAIRFRKGDGDKEAELTYKQRKSTTSIADRVEINIPLKAEASGYDVRAFLGYLGAEEDFTIEKVSYIYHLVGQVSAGELPYKATLALYDVKDEEGNVKRFLEVEIEADSACSSEEGLKALDRWKRLIQNRLNVKGPLNASLYELYSRGPGT